MNEKVQKLAILNKGDISKQTEKKKKAEHKILLCEKMYFKYYVYLKKVL